MEPWWLENGGLSCKMAIVRVLSTGYVVTVFTALWTRYRYVAHMYQMSMAFSEVDILMEIGQGKVEGKNQAD